VHLPSFILGLLVRNIKFRDLGHCQTSYLKRRLNSNCDLPSVHSQANFAFPATSPHTPDLHQKLRPSLTALCVSSHSRTATAQLEISFDLVVHGLASSIEQHGSIRAASTFAEV
jgi:hypothetical protein